MCAAAQQYKARVEARDSEVHGKGVFALTDLRADDTLIEYVGEIIDWEEALRLIEEGEAGEAIWDACLCPRNATAPGVAL